MGSGDGRLCVTDGGRSQCGEERCASAVQLEQERATAKFAVGGAKCAEFGLLKRDEVVKQLPKRALRLVDLKLVKEETPVKSRAKAAGAKS
jgi:hypothetical protein